MTSKITYKGNLRTECLHLQSKNTITTDAPTDNMGKGEFFSPTDLTATSLAACILTTLGIFGKKENRKWDFTGTEIKCAKVMYNNPRRIGEIHLTIVFPPNNWDDKDQMLIERVARTCPVRASLHPDIKIVENYNFDAQAVSAS
ncbi:MAG: hypothetical protein RL708_7 [Bacteroidota bacterium]|jgi:uncharacterized OsmC-like protein